MCLKAHILCDSAICTGVLPFKVLFRCPYFLSISGTNDSSGGPCRCHQRKPGPLLLNEGKQGEERSVLDGTENPK